MKKLFLTCAAVVGISAVFAANAFAADPIVNDAGFSKTEGTYSVKSDLSAYTGQMTILIIPESIYTGNATIEDKDIYYIDQTAAPASGSKIFQSVGILGGTTLKEGTSYIVKIGGENIAESGIIVEKFTVAKTATGTETEIIWGDVNTENGVELGDVNAIVHYILGTADTFGDYTVGQEVGGIVWGDINTENGVELGDANAIVHYILGTADTFGDYTVGSTVKITK